MRCRLTKFLVIGLLLLGWAGMVMALPADEPLPDAQQEAAARAIMEEVRCLVCQNQSIADSNADMAQDLRMIIREQIAAGKSRADVETFLLERYGDWVLFDPPMSPMTVLLWVGPVLFLLLGVAGVWLSSRVRHDRTTPPPPKSGIAMDRKAPSKSLLVAFIAGLMVFAVVFYMRLGQPGMADQGIEQADIIVEDPEGTGGELDLNQVIKDLRRTLATHPDSLEGWQHLARVAGALDEYGEVANAFGQMARLQPEDANLRVLQAEALIRQAGGRITPAARLALSKADQLHPDHPAARYYDGLWYFQDGNFGKALEVWKGLLSVTADDDPWKRQLERQISRAEAQMRPQISTDMASQAANQVASMSAEEQRAFINAMIDRLRARLEENPNDFDGWLRLARAEEQMGRFDAAIAALDAARAVAPSDVMAQLEAEIVRLRQLKTDME